MKKSIIIGGSAVILAIIIITVFSRMTARKDLSTLYAEVKTGQFDINVTTTGELQAENSTDIRGPEITQSRNIRSVDIKIQDLVAEGTEVKEGDYVATLDKTNLDNSLKDELERLETYLTNYEVKLLDTTVTLTNLRDNIKNQKFTVEEARITLDQSKFEPPTTIRQAEINLDKAQRTLDQLQRSYALRLEQTKSDIRRTELDIARQRERISELQEILSKFIIKAPAAGMVIYKKERNGTKRKVGSSINPWDPVVATLPDLSSMISKTYVNEIDVSKVKTGQRVEITVDAFPERLYTGTVTSVANIGEQLPNADAKVFEVLIKVDGTDPILRPSMTTGNKIVTKTIDNVAYIPLECVQAGEDSIPFVYTKRGYKQVVLLGEANEDHVVVEKGIEVGDVLYLSTPEDTEKFSLTGEELIAQIKEREKAKKEEEMKMRAGDERPREGRMRMQNMTPEQIKEFQARRAARQAGQGTAGDSTVRRQMNPQGGQQQPGQRNASPVVNQN
jgi:hypothetical protein